MMSHVDYAWEHVLHIANTYASGDCALAWGVKASVAAKLLSEVRKGGRKTLKTIERFGELEGLSVAEMMLKEDIETDWYAETRAFYLADNMHAVRVSNGDSMYAVAKFLIGKGNSQMVKQYEDGESMPTPATVQRFADHYGVEVADLFLPPDGIGVGTYD